MAVTIAPLTTTVMNAVDAHHAGTASGVNNAVARVAGLLAIAVFGVVLARTFETHVAQAVHSMNLPVTTEAAIDRELPKLAGIDVDRLTMLDRGQRTAVRLAIDEGFVAAFRRVIL